MLNIGAVAYEIRIHILGEWRVIYVAKFSSGVYVFTSLRRNCKNIISRYWKTKKPIQADAGEKMKEKIIKSSGNVFDDLGFSKEEAAVFMMRADLMTKVKDSIAKNGWTQSEAAAVLQISQSRVSDLMRGKRDKFSLDRLVMLATRAGNKVALEIAA